MGFIIIKKKKIKLLLEEKVFENLIDFSKPITLPFLSKIPPSKKPVLFQK